MTTATAVTATATEDSTILFNATTKTATLDGYTVTRVSKGGDWVLPITDTDGNTIYALQINKSADDKNNIKSILAEYKNANIEVFAYSGKNDKTVLLVDATQKIRATRTSATTEKLIASAVKMFGVTEQQAREMVADAKKQ